MTRSWAVRQTVARRRTPNSNREAPKSLTNRRVAFPPAARGQNEGPLTDQSGRERRLKPRFAADVTCTVALTDAEHNMLFPNEKLHCRTRDVSESGIGLVANSIYLGYTCVVDEGRALVVTLELPAGPVRMEATSAHYLRLDAGARDAIYLIGLRITSMEEGARAAYAHYLEGLGAQEQG